MKVRIYTDGACSGNPGPGGWGCALFFDDGTSVQASGHDPNTTNNRMEMMAAVQALLTLQAHCSQHKVQAELVELYTDSEYLRNGITTWIHSWEKNGWKTSAKKEVKNKDLWMQLRDLSNACNVQWFWVKGHSGHPENELVDQLARNKCMGD